MKLRWFREWESCMIDSSNHFALSSYGLIERRGRRRKRMIRKQETMLRQDWLSSVSISSINCVNLQQRRGNGWRALSNTLSWRKWEECIRGWMNSEIQVWLLNISIDWDWKDSLKRDSSQWFRKQDLTRKRAWITGLFRFNKERWEHYECTEKFAKWRKKEQIKLIYIGGLKCMKGCLGCGRRSSKSCRL